jgi:hypothetical protein
VDLIGREIEQAFPGQGVVVLSGGDHGAKLAAERRFRQPAGPKVMVCTAAGREGINLQFARVLFNFDLPWNPMDVEQRIGRIHRYGQQHTAQVYNLVLSDTIEGRIFLLLEDKLLAIAKAVGKVDERGEVAEDLRAQILGQLAERLNYDKLYQQALCDPELKRTRVELEAALANSREARDVVFDLFQDLDGFSLEDYKPISDVAGPLARVERFLAAAVADRHWRLVREGRDSSLLERGSHLPPVRLSIDRERGLASEDTELLGLDHPLVQEELRRWSSLDAERCSSAIASDVQQPALLCVWRVEVGSAQGQKRAAVHFVCVDVDGRRVPVVERRFESGSNLLPASPALCFEGRHRLVHEHIEPALQRECELRYGSASLGFAHQLIGCVEVVPALSV